jgi:glycosyltransferase involved in cell wall biosynthesis
MARRDSRVRFLGFQRDVAPLLASADVYISASETEGFPLSVLEARRCGLYLILSDIVSHREVLESEPGGGTLFQPGHTRALREVLVSSHAALTTRPLPHTPPSMFSAAQMADRYNDLYDRLLTA